VSAAARWGLNTEGDWLSQREQLPDFVCVAEVDLMSDKQGLQRLLGSLLGVESNGVVRDPQPAAGR
jgi:hypothetical protein